MKGDWKRGKESWLEALRGWASKHRGRLGQPAIGLALGGGFARGIAHVGVLRVFERYQIPVSYLGGVSAGAMVAGAWASGATSEEIGRIGGSMRFSDVARWSLSRMGFAASKPMNNFLRRLLKVYRFEEMKIPLAVVATDLNSGEPVYFRGQGDVIVPIRASCSYPGLFQPLEHEGRLLVDGAMSIDIPAAHLRRMGANRVISVHLPMQQGEQVAPSNLFQVVSRCFQIMQGHTQEQWRRHSDLVIEPDVTNMEWDSFQSAERMIEAGEKAALAAMPKIQSWLGQARSAEIEIAAAPDLHVA
ncbi:MAG: patatin-like phospholipase family protein [Candidatus Solibacter usitatus]|nr:patatin-like phospholipase family protein [Candidatus Solibacter usitatus]